MGFTLGLRTSVGAGGIDPRKRDLHQDLPWLPRLRDGHCSTVQQVRLSAGAFRQVAGLVLVAFRWIISEERGDLYTLHSQSSDCVQKKGTLVQHVPSL